MTRPGWLWEKHEPKKVPCLACGSTGRSSYAERACLDCGGSGYREAPPAHPDFSRAVKCPGGSGEALPPARTVTTAIDVRSAYPPLRHGGPHLPYLAFATDPRVVARAEQIGLTEADPTSREDSATRLRRAVRPSSP